MSFGTSLLSKVIETNDPTVLLRYGLTRKDFQTDGERSAFEYISAYAEKNGNQAPTAEMVATEVPTFQPEFSIEAPFEYLAKKAKETAAMHDFANTADSELAKRFNQAQENGNPQEFFDWLKIIAEQNIMRTSVRKTVGTNVVTDVDKFRAEYEKRKAGESFRIWNSKFPALNKAIGGYVSSNMYVVYGKSGRGKSAITLEESINCAVQGANVLIWSMEMGWFEVLVRIYVSLSGDQGVALTEIDGQQMEAGFDSRSVRQGKLSEEFETAFMEFIATLNTLIAGSITVRAVDDKDFDSRSLKDLKADIEQTNADVVMVDPFYYLDYESNSNKTTGGAAADTSKKMRRLAGTMDVVIFAITQAGEDDATEDEDGNREIKLPKRKDVMKTSALLQDAAVLIPVDTNVREGRGLVGVNKGRDGGEDEVVEIVYLPQVGLIKQVAAGERDLEAFGF
ncbi:DnaB helicase C-terminal domain-containing protein [Bacillus pumilus]|uniref:DnaB helicase C-terminal domain-containing protein n=1 Tax=Bacillus pumilus TaxID=1408 RepID=UPI00209F6D09|nr:DnaB helicase C-terminal domain-containing protein [Bacillus pumilus]MCP1528556.1 replicative DNA helicase [Bacillus pumilus]MDF9783935.1 replicative DNA helicase [Bacillus pumilus]